MNSEAIYIFLSVDNKIFKLWDKPLSSLLDKLKIPVYHAPFILEKKNQFQLSWN